jgi:hypothetical protein
MQVTVVSTSIGSNTYWAYPFNRTKNNYPAPFDLYNTTVYIGTGVNIAGYGDYGVNFGTLTTRSMVSTTLSASKIEQFLNGTNRLSRPGSYPYGDGSVGLYQIATRADRVTQFTGEINEVIVTNELSNSDRVSLEAYLAAKWSLSGVPTPPATSSAPAITGVARTGETLTTSNGTWTGTPTSYAYQWQRSSSSGVGYSNIASAANNTYVLTDADIGKYIRVSVVATNSVGSTSVSSLATSIVVDLPDSDVPIASTPVATATGFSFTISNYSNLYTYALTTSKGSVLRSNDDVTVTGLVAGESATVTIGVTRTNYKSASKAVFGSAFPAPTTTTTAAPALSIVIQAPVTTVAQGQASVATVAPTTTTLPVLGANGVPVPTTTTTIT